MYAFEVKSDAYSTGWRRIAAFDDWDDAEFVFFAYAEKLDRRAYVSHIDYLLSDYKCPEFAAIYSHGHKNTYRLRTV